MAPIEPIAYLLLVKTVAFKMKRNLGPVVWIEELISDGWLGLLRAILRFDSARRIPFRAFARLHIRGAMLDGLRERAWLPRSCHGPGRFVPKFLPLTDSALAVEPGVPPIDLRDWLSYALSRLPTRLQVLIRLHYFEHLPLQQIARRFAVTPARVSQLHAKALRRLRMLAWETRRPRGRRAPAGPVTGILNPNLNQR